MLAKLNILRQTQGVDTYERTDNEAGLKQLNDLEHHRFRERILERDLVALRRELEGEALGERLVCGAEEEDLHFCVSACKYAHGRTATGSE